MRKIVIVIFMVFSLHALPKWFIMKYGHCSRLLEDTCTLPLQENVEPCPGPLIHPVFIAE